MPRAGSASEPVRVISKWNNKRKCLRESLREKEKTNVGMLILSNPSSLSCGSRTLLLMGTPEFLKILKKNMYVETKCYFLCQSESLSFGKLLFAKIVLYNPGFING